MKLTHLGNGAAFCPARNNTAAYFIIEETLYLIDCGESNFARIEEEKLFDLAKDIVVIVTHMHADHVGSLGSLISYAKMVKEMPITVVHPEENLVKLLDLMGIDQDGYQLIQTNTYKNEHFSILFLPVIHAESMVCYGLLIEDANEKIWYSGDSSNFPEGILEDFIAGNIQRIYQDTGEKPSKSHMYYKELEKFIPEERRKDVYCMHLAVVEEQGTYIEELKEAGFSIAEVGG